ncbi:MAG: HAD-IA family hydrolase [Candidatus Omnitrophica bacterium]|nr:HAD-IA family hydrolase [Candidatus Omnitrophota bacterium]
MSIKKLILYDLDGTLVDTRQDIINSVRYALGRLNGPELMDDEIKDCVGTGLHALIRRVFRMPEGALKPEEETLTDQGAKLYRQHYKSHMLDHSRVYPGAKDFLESLKDRKQAVITNKPNPFSVQILKGLGILKYFIAVLAGDNGLPFKPDPAAIHHLMEETGATAEETLFIGDSLIDIDAARNAGVEVVTLSHGFTAEGVLREAGPDFVLRDFQELGQLVREKGW